MSYWKLAIQKHCKFSLVSIPENWRDLWPSHADHRPHKLITINPPHIRWKNCRIWSVMEHWPNGISSWRVRDPKCQPISNRSAVHQPFHGKRWNEWRNSWSIMWNRCTGKHWRSRWQSVQKLFDSDELVEHSLISPNLWLYHDYGAMCSGSRESMRNCWVTLRGSLQSPIDMSSE